MGLVHPGLGLGLQAAQPPAAEPAVLLEGPRGCNRGSGARGREGRSIRLRRRTRFSARLHAAR